MTTQPPLAILGAGAWGTALAIHLAQLHQKILLWGQTADQMLNLQLTRVNTRYLSNKRLPENIWCTSDLNEIFLEEVQEILLVVPSHAFRSVLQRIKPYFTSNRRLIWATKGLDSQAHQLLPEVVKNILGKVPYAALSGPSFAHEVAAGLPTAVTIASPFPEFLMALQQRFHSPYFRVYTTKDIIGVSVAGAMKNVLAIAVGIAEGLGLGANAQAALMTRGLSEMLVLTLALGGKLETLLGLSGVGDLTLTCMDNQSRNRRLGLALGQGQTVLQAQKTLGQLSEGFHTSHAIFHLSQAMGIVLPIFRSVYQILYEQADPSKITESLLNRPLPAKMEISCLSL